MVDTGTMVTRLEGLLGTKDLSDREAEFVENMVRIKDSGQVTRLTERQVEWLNDLHRKHFA